MPASTWLVRWAEAHRRWVKVNAGWNYSPTCLRRAFNSTSISPPLRAMNEA